MVLCRMLMEAIQDAEKRLGAVICIILAEAEDLPEHAFHILQGAGLDIILPRRNHIEFLIGLS